MRDRGVCAWPYPVISRPMQSGTRINAAMLQELKDDRVRQRTDAACCNA